jgi:uncharacterized protein YndB with AHSA1/START domain
MSTERVSVSRRIAAPAQTVFGLVSDPRMHVEIDGSGMLVAARDARPLTAVGDTFDMDMDREALGDIPLGKYKVRNTVVQLEAPRVFAWNVGGIGQPPFGHVYGYELTEVGPEATDVTLYCDWSGVPDEAMRGRFPIVPVTMLEKSLENLDRLATGG